MQTSGAAGVVLERISKTYPNGFQAIQGLDLDVQPGEWLVLIGPSGCGKTTTLRIIAGLEEPTQGTIRIGGQNANALPPWRRGVAMVFQRPALVPTTTVQKNLEFGAGDCGPTRATQVSAVARRLGLMDVLDRMPHQLSGGQQQRVALGRALGRPAPLYLLDEPLGQLDAPLRDDLRRELQEWHQERQATVISVTHDPREAWALGRRVAVMDQGRMIQVGAPAELEGSPRHEFVARFFAQGALNFFDAQLRQDGNCIQWTSRIWPDALPLPARPQDPREARVALRAEHVKVGAASGSKSAAKMKVALVERCPHGAWVTGDVQGMRITGWADKNVEPAFGADVRIAMDWPQAYVFDRVTGLTLHAPAG